MSISPVFHCKKCYFLTHSSVSVGGGSNIYISDCRWQCCGCGKMINVNHMSIHGGDVFVLGDSESFDVLVAHVVEVGRSVRNWDSKYVFLDESRIPLAFAWAKKIAKKYPEQTFIFLSTIASLSLAITTMIDGRRHHRQSMELASELASIQLEQAQKLAQVSESDSLDICLKLAVRVSDILEKIQAEKIQSDQALRKLITEHNRAMSEIHRFINESHAQTMLEMKQGETRQQMLDEKNRLIDLLRRSGMPLPRRQDRH